MYLPWTPSSSLGQKLEGGSSRSPAALWVARISAHGLLYPIRQLSMSFSIHAATCSCTGNNLWFPSRPAFWSPQMDGTVRKTAISRAPRREASPGGSLKPTADPFAVFRVGTFSSKRIRSISKFLRSVYHSAYGVVLTYSLSVPSCIPGLAYKGAPAYIELRDEDLMNLAWMNVQREFYQVIKFSYYFTN